MKYIKSIAAAITLLLPFSAYSQSDEYNPVDFSLQLKNKHLWRGYQVSNESLAATMLTLKDKSGAFNVGLWGGAGFTGKYKEFDYFASFEKNGFKIAVWDIYNFANDPSGRENGKIFEYSPRKTGHFIDLSVSYRLQGGFPLNISWATIIFGCDRGALNEKNLYSSYVSLDYPVLRGKAVDVSLGIAGAFALDPETGSDAHFYSKDPNIVNINVTASKKVNIGSYVLPVSVMGMFNPANNEANLQIALDIF